MIKLKIERDIADYTNIVGLSVEGFSLRDYFAGQAIGLFVLDSTNIKLLQENKGYPMHDLVADFCYNLADQMIKRREEK